MSEISKPEPWVNTTSKNEAISDLQRFRIAQYDHMEE
mgnify:CR=1 FL=1